MTQRHQQQRWSLAAAMLARSRSGGRDAARACMVAAANIDGSLPLLQLTSSAATSAPQRQLQQQQQRQQQLGRQQWRHRRRAPTAVAAAGHAPPPALPHAQVDDAPKARLAVFVSGGGSNFKAIHAACLDGRINAEVVVSAPSRTGGRGAQRQTRAVGAHPRCCSGAASS